MSAPDEWTDADFVPRYEDRPDLPSNPSEQTTKERLEWYRREIRSRLGIGETQAQVIAWLVKEGISSDTAEEFMLWAQTAAPIHPPGGVVFCVEQRYESGVVVTDPVASAAARAEARRERLARNAPPPEPAPEFEFAQPADSTLSRLSHENHRSRLWLAVAGLVVLVGAVAAIALAF